MSEGKRRWVIGAIVVAAIVLAALVTLLVMLRPTEVPDIRKQPVAQATALLEAAGLSLEPP